jgi:hypothetical protein
MALYSTNVGDFSADQVSVRMSGITGTTTASGVTNIDHKFNEDRLMNAGILLVKGGKWGDYVVLQVVDKDNVLGYGAGFVLRNFAENYYINPDSTFQVHYEVPYVGRLYNSFYLRLAYSATDADERKIALNLITHIPTE